MSVGVGTERVDQVLAPRVAFHEGGRVWKQEVLLGLYFPICFVCGIRAALPTLLPQSVAYCCFSAFRLCCFGEYQMTTSLESNTGGCGLAGVAAYLSVEPLDLGFEGTARTALSAAAMAVRLSLWFRISRRSLLMPVSGSQSSGRGFNCSSAICSALLALDMCTPTGLPHACCNTQASPHLLLLQVKHNTVQALK